MKTHSLLLPLLLASLSACASSVPGDGPVGRRAEAIQGGQAETSSSFAVAVVQNEETMCSGTLIAPNLVLTARHCVAGDNGADFVDCGHDQFLAASAASTFRVSTAASVSFGSTTASSSYKVTKVVVPSSAAFCGNDVALLVLDGLVPASAATPATPAIGQPLTDRATYGSSVVAIGYGTTSISAKDEGTRRRRDGVPYACIPGDTTLGCDPADLSMVDTELAAGDGLCDGDSGSGAYVPKSLTGGAPLVVGVLSRSGENGNVCTHSVYERVDKMGSFLVAAVVDAANTGGYPVPAWATDEPSAPDAGADPSAPPAAGDDPGAGDGTNAASGASSSGDGSSGCAVGARQPTRGAGAAIAGLLLFAAASARRRRSRH